MKLKVVYTVLDDEGSEVAKLEDQCGFTGCLPEKQNRAVIAAALDLMNFHAKEAFLPASVE